MEQIQLLWLFELDGLQIFASGDLQHLGHWDRRYPPCSCSMHKGASRSYYYVEVLEHVEGEAFLQIRVIGS
jgi:hypothetical protein